MPNASDINAGGAAVRLSLNDADLAAQLVHAQERLTNFFDVISNTATALGLGGLVSKVSGWITSYANAAEELYATTTAAGKSFADLDAAAAEAGYGSAIGVMKARELAKAFKDLKEVALDWKGTFNSVAAALAPLLTPFLKKLTEIRTELFGVSGVVTEFVKSNQMLVQALGAVVGAAALGATALTGVAAAVGIAGKVWGTASKAAVFFWGGLTKLATAAFSLTYAVVGLLNPMRILSALTWVGNMTIRLFTGSYAIMRGVVLGSVAAIRAAGAAMMGLSAVTTAASGIMTAAFTIPAMVMAAIPLLIGTIVTAIVGLGAYFWATSQQGQAAFSEIGRVFQASLGVIKDVWAGITDAIEAGDLTLAMRVAGAGLQVAWAETVVYAMDRWGEFTAFIQDTFGVSVMEAFRNMKVAWVETIAFMKSAWLGLNAAGESIGDSFGNLVIRGLAAAGMITQDAANTAIVQGNTAGQSAARDRDAQLAQIGQDRIAARNRAAAPSAAGASQAQRDAAAAANRELESYLIEAQFARMTREVELENSFASTPAADAGGLGKGAVRSTFNKDVLWGFGATPEMKIVENTKQMVELLRPLGAQLDQLNERFVRVMPLRVE